MRINCLIAVIGVCLGGMLTGRAQAEPFRIASFSDARSYKYFLGTTQSACGNANVEGYDWYSTTRNWLLTPEIFGSDVTVSLEEISDGRSQLLGQGIDLLIMNEVAPLSGDAGQAEAQAIAQFVLDGGCLVVIADTLQCGQGVAAGNQVLAALDGGTSQAGRYGDIVSTDSAFETATSGHFSLDPGSASNLVWGGAFNYQMDGADAGDLYAGSLDDVLERARFGATDHVAVLAGDWGQVVGRRALSAGPTPTFSNVLMEIRGGTLDVGLSRQGAGNVLVVGDTIFANDMTSPIAPGFNNADPSDNNNNHNNAQIMMNFVHQQVVPEPSTLVLLAMGLLGLAGRLWWRR